MEAITEDLTKLFAGYSQAPIRRIEKIQQSGSNRIYFRLRTDESSYVATVGSNIAENKSFL